MKILLGFCLPAHFSFFFPPSLDEYLLHLGKFRKIISIKKRTELLTIGVLFVCLCWMIRIQELFSFIM